MRKILALLIVAFISFFSCKTTNESIETSKPDPPKLENRISTVEKEVSSKLEKQKVKRKIEVKNKKNTVEKKQRTSVRGITKSIELPKAEEKKEGEKKEEKKKEEKKNKEE